MNLEKKQDAPIAFEINIETKNAADMIIRATQGDITKSSLGRPLYNKMLNEGLPTMYQHFAVAAAVAESVVGLLKSRSPNTETEYALIRCWEVSKAIRDEKHGEAEKIMLSLSRRYQVISSIAEKNFIPELFTITKAFQNYHHNEEEFISNMIEGQSPPQLQA